MTDHDADGTLDGWDDELNDWTEDDHVTDVRAAEFNRLVAKAEARDQRIAAGLCIRPDTADDMTCSQGYDHTGHCDWWNTPVVADVLARIQPDNRIDRAQAAYNAALLADLPALPGGRR